MLLHVAIVIALALSASGIGVAVRTRRIARGEGSTRSGDLAARCHDLVADIHAPHGIAGVVAVIAAGVLLLATRAPRTPEARRTA